jgi:hypothetical protein
VETHLATWRALHDDGQGRSAPALTEREFRRYLGRGIVAHGFFRPGSLILGVPCNRILRGVCAESAHSGRSAYASWQAEGVCSMKNFIRSNPTIAFGLGLPLALVLLFLAISGIPALVVAPPEHEVLYATNYNHHSNPANGIQIAVVGDRVEVNYYGSTQAYQYPRLWRFNPKTGAVKEIPLMLPAGLLPNSGRPADAERPLTVTPIKAPDLATLKVDSSSLAPDGYRFSAGGDAYSQHFFTGFFHSSRYRYQAELVKNGRSVRLPETEHAYYGNAVRFVGWVVSP